MTSEVIHSRDPDRVRDLFGRIAPCYDRANHVFSMGFDLWWRRRVTEEVARWNAPCLLDLATGSGDLALALYRRLSDREITGADFSTEMLARAQQKGVRNLVLADALALPFASRSFDGVTIAFGLRNMTDWAAALRESRRILTNSGYLLVLDFSLPTAPLLRPLYRFYLHRVMPGLSRLLTQEKDAYQYLGASIEAFPSGEGMCQLIRSAGFREVRAQPLTCGIVTFYTATVSPPPDSAT